MKRTAISVTAVLLLGLVSLSWGREDRLNSTSVTPGATGVVETDTDRNGNTSVEVRVEHLAAPEKLTPPKSLYVVWIQARGKDAESLGQLRVNKDLGGSMRTVTQYKVFDLFVTAEDDAKAEQPSGMEVLRGHVERD